MNLSGYDTWKTQEPPEGPDLERAHEAAESKWWRLSMGRLVGEMRQLQSGYVHDFRTNIGEDGDCLNEEDCRNEALQMAIEELEQYEKAES